MSDIATLIPEPTDTELAAAALRALDAALGAEGPVRLHLGVQASEVEVALAASAVIAHSVTSSQPFSSFFFQLP